MKPCNVGRMADQTSDGGPALAEVEGARHALVEAALGAYEDAGLSGLCAEGRWEAAVSALRGLDLRAYGSPRDGGAARPTGERFAAAAAASAAAMPTPGGGSVAIRVNVTTLAGARDATPASRFADAASVLAARASLAKGRAAAAVERACARQVRLDRDRRL
jgi:hypothetical protein